MLAKTGWYPGRSVRQLGSGPSAKQAVAHVEYTIALSCIRTARLSSPGPCLTQTALSGGIRKKQPRTLHTARTAEDVMGVAPDSAQVRTGQRLGFATPLHCNCPCAYLPGWFLAPRLAPSHLSHRMPLAFRRFVSTVAPVNSPIVWH